MNICLYMIYTLGTMLCIKMLQASGGIQLPLEVYACSYNITTREGVAYRKTQAHFKPYQPQCKKTEDEHFDSDMQTSKANCKQFDNIKSKKQIKCNLILDQKETLSLQLNLICDALSDLCINILDIFA